MYLLLLVRPAGNFLPVLSPYNFRRKPNKTLKRPHRGRNSALFPFQKLPVLAESDWLKECNTNVTQSKQVGLGVLVYTSESPQRNYDTTRHETDDFETGTTRSSAPEAKGKGGRNTPCRVSRLRRAGRGISIGRNLRTRNSRADLAHVPRALPAAPTRVLLKASKMRTALPYAGNTG